MLSSLFAILLMTDLIQFISRYMEASHHLGRIQDALLVT
jgi:hypothetical protein